MRQNVLGIASALALATVVAVGCSDREAPTAAVYSMDAQFARKLQAPDVAASEKLTSPVTVEVLKRNVPLLENISVTQEIGKMGGTIEIPEAGVKVKFPENSVIPSGRFKTVAITVTALAGDAIAYTFEPHGTQFKDQVKIHQDLKVTTAFQNHTLLSLLNGAYFEHDPIDGLANVTEFFPVEMAAHGAVLSFGIEHFSGYLVSVGRGDKNR